MGTSLENSANAEQEGTSNIGTRSNQKPQGTQLNFIPRSCPIQ